MSKKSCNQRIQDVSNETGRPLSPITLEGTPLKTIEEALAPLNLQDLEEHLFNCDIAIQQLDAIPHGLTRDEAIAVRMYTTEWQEKVQSLYYKLNEALRTVSREAVKPYFAYMKLLFSGLAKLPSHQSPSMTIWRGVSLDISKNFSIGKKYFWWGLSSCTTDINILKQFLGNGPRVVFSISFLSHCCDIKEFSCFEQESEILLLPGRCFEVLNVGSVTNDGLTIVQLREVVAPNMIKGVQFPVVGNQVKGEKEEKSVVVDGEFKKWFSGVGISASLEEEYCKKFAVLGFDSLSVLGLIKENEFEKYFSDLPPGHRIMIWNQISKIQMTKNENKITEKAATQKEEKKETKMVEKKEVSKETQKIEKVNGVAKEKVLTIEWNGRKDFNCINCNEKYSYYEYGYYEKGYKKYKGSGGYYYYKGKYKSYEYESYGEKGGGYEFELGDILICHNCDQKCIKFI